MVSAEPALIRHPDRLLPAEPAVRGIARRLYDAVRDLPIISPHGHVDPRVLLFYVGVPWWFLDAPDAVRRFREAATESTGFSRTSGFVDDTRAFCSIPARHDMSRRIDCGYLARLVDERRIDEDEAVDTAVDLVAGLPRKVVKL